MFTGLIQAIGTISQLVVQPRSRRIGIQGEWDIADIRPGESIAIDGACFTVTRHDGSQLFFDVSPESLDRTTIGQLKRGDRVHLERALRLSDRLGGHLVLGHVDGLGTIRSRRQEADCWLLTLSAPESILDFLVEKGSIAVNGVSLTVNTYTSDSFSVMIVPHTAERTLLTRLPVGTQVNLETDVIGKYVARFLALQANGDRDHRLLQRLQEQGFM